MSEIQEIKNDLKRLEEKNDRNFSIILDKIDTFRDKCHSLDLQINNHVAHIREDFATTKLMSQQNKEILSDLKEKYRELCKETRTESKEQSRMSVVLDIILKVALPLTGVGLGYYIGLFR